VGVWGIEVKRLFCPLPFALVHDFLSFFLFVINMDIIVNTYKLHFLSFYFSIPQPDGKQKFFLFFQHFYILPLFHTRNQIERAFGYVIIF
jgi:hypothetical protein